MTLSVRRQPLILISELFLNENKRLSPKLMRMPRGCHESVEQICIVNDHSKRKKLKSSGFEIRHGFLLFYQASECFRT
ncbi:hypothetical protein CEXT_96751 [Caerostris extrusa]|uniref:Uncharacterized protein n=1 Tax=Caerostris extrusa TaxID=172846 RepID=A0AAV4RJ80_CAEEX|nr:hypothetical protein CEXT_96751 [Caerostris extrusa]